MPIDRFLDELRALDPSPAFDAGGEEVKPLVGDRTLDRQCGKQQQSLALCRQD
jgi:hypothetical protein